VKGKTSLKRYTFIIERFASPLLSCTMGLFPFPYADLSSLFDESRAKNTYFSTYTHPIYYARCVYVGCSTTAHVHRDFCQKIQKWSWVSMSQQEISDPWPSIYWKHSNSALQLHIEGYKSTVRSYGKEEKEFNFESKVTMEKLLHIESTSLLSLKSEHSVKPPKLFPVVERTSLYLSFDLAFGGGLKWWRPSWKELGFLVSNHADTEVCNVVTSANQLLIEMLLSCPIGILQIYDYYPWACL
jgi:hypothetical protein